MSLLPRTRGRLLRSLLALAAPLALAVGSAHALAAQQFKNTDAYRTTTSPRSGPPGTEVTVKMGGLPASKPMLIGFGTIGGDGYEMIGKGETDKDGMFVAKAKIPAWAKLNHGHFFFVAYTDQRPASISDVFLVTPPDGAVTMEGRITDEGKTCPAMRGPDNGLFTLTGDTGSLKPGEHVVVEGRVMENGPCDQGLTLKVSRVKPTDGAR